MAGAMRKMGIYLGLVEDDDARAYGRYDARQADPAGHYEADRYDADRFDGDRYDGDRYDERRSDRHEGRYEGRYEDRYASEPHGSFDSYGGEYDRYDDRRYDDERADPVRGGERGTGRGIELAPDPEPVALRRGGATRLGLAQPAASGAGTAGTSAPVAAGPSRLGAVGGGLGGGVAGGLGGGVGGGAGVASAAAAGLAAREQVAVAPEPAPAPAREPYRITTLHPKTYNEARAIGEAFRDGSPVIMNLTELDHADARRLVDFAAGLIFGLRGSIEPVTAKVFLLSPQDVDVTAEDKAKIREGGFFDQS
ncbi:cell division protein SepF [Geodermatophilus sp. URMC 63]